MDSLLSWIKLPKNVVWPIVLVSGLLLWAPEKFNKGLGLDLFIHEYRIWIGVAFLFFLATGLMPVLPWTFRTGFKMKAEAVGGANRLASSRF